MSKPAHPKLQSAVHRFLDEGQQIAIHFAQGLTSLAWVWPIRGMVFALTHPNIIISVRSALIKSFVSSAIIFGVLAFFTYLPQMAVVAIFTGPLAPLVALFLVGAESAFILALLARSLFLEPALTAVFDNTLRAREQGELVKAGKTRTLGTGRGAATSVEGAVTKPLQILSKDGLMRYLLSLPLNLAPIIGTVLFLFYNGYSGGPGWHSRYFQLKGFTKGQRANFIARRRAEYTAFGITALLFNFIPLVNLLFSFTNTVGAAMWAAQIEIQADIIDYPPKPQPTKATAEVADQTAIAKERVINGSGEIAKTK